MQTEADKPPSESPTAALPSPPHQHAFPIIGIGASAGGLEALEQLLAAAPPKCGMAFVVVQHLDPTRHGMLPELLQRVTPMQVKQAANRMRVEPDCVYVIPPNKDLALRHGTLYLHDPVAPRGLRLPIDAFLTSLAEDRHDQAIGIILSGMGADGTQGFAAIRGQGGLTLAQEPTTAKFDAMPQSVIDAGLAEMVAPPGEMVMLILQRLEPSGLPAAAAADSPARHSAFEKICELLHSQTRHDFSHYKKSTMYRRIERRMGIHQLPGIADYVAYLQENSQEIELLFKELLIGVTHFFRDSAAWMFLQAQVLPELIQAKPDGTTLRAWVAGCSSGEEAYTLAIAFRETVEQLPSRERIELQIFATDLDPDAIARARQGYYPKQIAEHVSPERLARFFREEGGKYRVSQEIRQMVVFAPHNVIMDPPFTRLDILTCRNLLIYLSADLQKKILPLFHYSLKSGGILVLGSAESIGEFGHLFTALNARLRIYRREPVAPKAGNVEFPTRHLPVPVSPSETQSPMTIKNLQTLADQLLLQKFSPAAVLINAAGDVLFIRGRTGKYLEPAAGKANWNIHAMAREGLRQELMLAIPKALRTEATVVIRDLKIEGDDESQSVDLTIYPISEPSLLQGMVMIVFKDVVAAKPCPPCLSGKPAIDERILELEEALRNAKAELQSMREEMQSSHEELKSANEELQSTNEELQSTNEELTTSKEEMQSLNEELQMVNSELQSKVDELSATSNDMKNLLNSTDIATVFLDNLLRVRRFTSQATHIFKLIPSDIGRPLSDIANEIDYPELQHDAQEVLRTLMFSEKQINGRDGGWFIVKILPYRTLDNVIDGVVITFIDISEAKHLEAELRVARAGNPDGSTEP